ncbi:MAG: hypothetical protein Q8N88_07135, partial [Nanoarchaeota archaeon]|nr:hypothetical protein [Nanoarchaeota archaeon]
NLNVIFRKTKFINNPIATSDLFKLKANILTYIVESLRRSNKKRELIINLINQQVPLYVWGIGREFLYLYSTLGMDKCHIIGFIDGNRYKQKNFTINGKKISDNSILINSNKKSALIITAMAYKNQIKSQLVDIDYKGQIINL